MYAFDPAGRPVSWVRDGVIYRRGLDGSVVELQRAPEAEGRSQRVRRLEPEQTRVQLDCLRAALLEAWEVLGNPEALRRAVQVDPLQDALDFQRIWRPVMILPPDQYRALVLQLTEGCSYNRCSFCTFYKNRRYRVRTLDEFRDHLEEALAFVGEGLSWRRGIFLADANAASLPDDQLVPALEMLRRRFAVELPACPACEPRHFHRVSSFLDTFSSIRRTVADWRRLVGLGLESLHLGLETGSDRVLRLLRKPGSSAQAERLVGTLKEAGMRLGVIVMTGVGGRALAAEHVQQTSDLLNRLPLDAGDRISLSEFEPDPLSPYVREGLAELLDRETCRQQSRAIRDRLRFAPYPAGPVVSHYDVRQFVY
jgi:radical SAM superfamily enzyme YgiQ (UPF0313 family)